MSRNCLAIFSWSSIFQACNAVSAVLPSAPDAAVEIIGFEEQEEIFKHIRDATTHEYERDAIAKMGTAQSASQDARLRYLVCERALMAYGLSHTCVMLHGLGASGAQ